MKMNILRIRMTMCVICCLYYSISIYDNGRLYMAFCSTYL